MALFRCGNNGSGGGGGGGTTSQIIISGRAVKSGASGMANQTVPFSTTIDCPFDGNPAQLLVQTGAGAADDWTSVSIYIDKIEYVTS